MLDRWNDAIALVEDRLTTDADGDASVDVAALARVVPTSEHHFRRVFSALAGMPISEYVRRRRLTVATAEVVEGARSVLDVAVRYGYGSGDAFTRALKAMHGITPAQARRPGAVLHSQPRLTFHLRIKGATTVRHRIEHTDPFRLVGRHARLPLVFEGENTAMTDFHRSLPADLGNRLAPYADHPALSGTLSVSSGFADERVDGSEFDYHHAVASTRAADDVETDLDVLEVDTHQWVVLATDEVPVARLQGDLQQLWASAYGEWFPANPYRTVPGPEVLRVRYDTEQATGSGELWLPIEREG